MTLRIESTAAQVQAATQDHAERLLADQELKDRFYHTFLRPHGIRIPPGNLFWAQPQGYYEGQQSVARPGTAWRFNEFGVLVPVDADGVVRDYDPATGEFRGALAEPARENLEPNPTLAGAAAGEIGNGGVLPTGWAIPADRGLTTEVVSTDINAGMGGVRIRVHGTPSSTGVYRLQTTVLVTRAPEDPAITISHFIRGAGGSVANIGQASLNLVNTPGGLVFDPFDADKIGAAFRSVTGSTASTISVRGEIRFAVTDGDPVDITLDIVHAQLEVGAFPSSPIPEGNTIRPATTMLLPQVGDRRRGWIAWEGVMDFDPAVDSTAGQSAWGLPFGNLNGQQVRTQGAQNLTWRCPVPTNNGGLLSSFPGGSLQNRLVRVVAWWDADKEISGISADGVSNQVSTNNTIPDGSPIRFGQTTTNRQGRSWTNWCLIGYNYPSIAQIEALTGEVAP